MQIGNSTGFTTNWLWHKQAIWDTIFDIKRVNPYNPVDGADMYANSVDPDETAHMSRLIRIHTVCHCFLFLTPICISVHVQVQGWKSPCQKLRNERVDWYLIYRKATFECNIISTVMSSSSKLQTSPQSCISPNDVPGIPQYCSHLLRNGSSRLENLHEGLYDIGERTVRLALNPFVSNNNLY